jgi:hypothetical protein
MGHGNIELLLSRSSTVDSTGCSYQQELCETITGRSLYSYCFGNYVKAERICLAHSKTVSMYRTLKLIILVHNYFPSSAWLIVYSEYYKSTCAVADLVHDIL